MALTYNTYVSSIANLFPVVSTDPGFVTVLPNIIDDAEDYLYPALDLLNTVVRDSSSTLSTGTRTFNLPTSIGTFLVVQSFNVITPSGTTNPEFGSRVPLTRTTEDTLDFLWPSATGSTVPAYYASVTQGQFIVGPWPDQTYTVEVVGTQRPVPLSSANQTTLLSTYFPAQLVAASMVFGAAYMKDFGSGSDNPQMAVSWKSHLDELMQPAVIEEARKKAWMAGWSDKQPSPMATPPRT
jgi:hypothetical protein